MTFYTPLRRFNQINLLNSFILSRFCCSFMTSFNCSNFLWEYELRQVFELCTEELREAEILLVFQSVDNKLIYRICVRKGNFVSWMSSGVYSTWKLASREQSEASKAGGGRSAVPLEAPELHQAITSINMVDWSQCCWKATLSFCLSPVLIKLYSEVWGLVSLRCSTRMLQLLKYQTTYDFQLYRIAQGLGLLDLFFKKLNATFICKSNNCTNFHNTVSSKNRKKCFYKVPACYWCNC